MKSRIDNIVHSSFKKESFERLKFLLMDNNYPSSLITKLLFTKSNSQTAGSINQGLPPDKIYRKLQCIKEVSPKIQNILREFNITVANYNAKTSKTFFSGLKDKELIVNKSNVVYKLTCQCNKTYIGMTAQKLKSRLCQHRSDANHKPVGCALSRHVFNTKRKKRLRRSQSSLQKKSLERRLFLEMCYINFEDNSLNNKKDIKGISSTYTWLLHLHKRRNSQGAQ